MNAVRLERSPASLAAAFREQSWVNIGPLLDEPVAMRAAAEARWVIEYCGTRVDVAVAATGHSPRRMTVAGQREIAACAPLLTELYYAESTRRLVSSIAGSHVDVCPFVPERFVLSSLRTPGDTHGWHWDDYSFALVWVIDAPDPGAGGEVELIANVAWDKANPRVTETLASRDVRRCAVRSGEAYLLRSDSTMHRVSELIAGTSRLAYAMAYASAEDLQRSVTHETTALLYPSA